MTQKLSNIIKAYKSLENMAKVDDLPFKLTFEIATIMNKMMDVIKPYEASMKGFIEKNGVYDKDLGVKKLPMAQEALITEYTKTTEELLEKEYDLDITKIQKKQLEPYKFDGNDVCNILWVID
jgi:hypothetical protein